MVRIAFDPYIPLSLWFPLAFVAGGFLAWYVWSSRNRLAGRRCWAIWGLMTLAILCPLGILLNPTWIEQVPPPPGKPLLTFLVDRSASMDTRDVEGKRSRFEKAVELATQAEKEYGERFEVRLRSFAADSKKVSAADLKSLKPDGASTDLAGAIEQSFDPERPQGQAVVLLSDGIHNSGGLSRIRESLSKARASAAPVFTQTLGGSTGVNDLEVELNLPQELAFASQQTPVAVHLRQRGQTASQAKVSLFLEGKMLQEREVTLKPDDSVETTFSIMQPKSGLYRYEVRVSPLTEEVTLANNSATLMLRVVDEPIRVLLMEGKPYWDTKFLVRTLAADPSIELTSVVRLTENRLLQRKVSRAITQGKKETEGAKSDPNKSSVEPTKETVASKDVPKDASNEPSTSAEKGSKVSDGAKESKGPANAAEANQTAENDASPNLRSEEWAIESNAEKYLCEGDLLNQFQIVVLGRDSEMFLSDVALARLKKWITEGEGSLVCFRGAPAVQINERLAQLLPLRWETTSESRFRVKMTGAGQGLRWMPGARNESDTLSGMPSLATVTKPSGLKALAVVLASASEGGSGQAVPVITYQPVGSGRVVVVEGAGMWRWAFLPPTYQERDDVYASLWRSLIRWMVSNVGLLPTQQLALRTDSTRFSTDEAVTAMMMIREDQLAGKVPEVELHPEGSTETKRFAPIPTGGPGQYRVAFGKLPEGHYRASVVGGSEKEVSGRTEFDVRGNLQERLDVQAKPDLMRLIADQSEGKDFSGGNLKSLVQSFEDHLVRTRPARTTQNMAWDRWWILAGVFSLWGVVWGIRRWSGLV